jgi:hypothetical protein
MAVTWASPVVPGRPRWLAIPGRLQVKQLRVEPTLRDECPVRPVLHQLPTAEHQDPRVARLVGHAWGRIHRCRSGTFASSCLMFSPFSQQLPLLG